jgi:hypothetical protein
MAPIFLVGTHKDVVPEPRDHDRISHILHNEVLLNRYLIASKFKRTHLHTTDSLLTVPLADLSTSLRFEYELVCLCPLNLSLITT